MKEISREGIKRMIDGGIGGGGGGGGVDPTLLAGYATQSWVDGSYLSNAFWNQLFEVTMQRDETVTDPSTTPATVISSSSTTRMLAPNELLPSNSTSTDEETGYVTTVVYSLVDIKVKAGLWTESFLSALGRNSAGGGGGGGGTDLNQPLLSINISGLSAPGVSQDGMTVVWDNTAGKWKYGSVGASSISWSNITNKPTTIGDYGITDAYISNGTITIGSNSITPWTANNHPTMLSDYGITDAYTKTDADAKFMTIAAFENLFNAIGSDGSTKINHPYASGVSSIKAMVGLWTNQYLSALGLNSSGGGGGGSLNEPLLSINNAGLSNHPSSSGQTIVWNGTAWVYGNAGSSTIAWSNITNKPTTIGDYGITDAYISNGTITLGLNSITPWTSSNHPTTLGDYGITDAYTKTEADATFMTIAAFENLFNAMNSSGQKVSHPYSSAVASIKAMVGLYTDQFLSALGLNSSGGGGGVSLNEPLLSINNAGLSDHPSSSGQTIIWNGSAWAYGTTGSGTVTSVAMSVPQGFNVSGSPITTSGTFAITFASGYALPTTADVNKGVTAYGWGDHSQVGYWKDGTGNHPTTLTGYGITDALPSSALSVAVSGSTLTITLSGSTYSLTDTNTWRPVEDNLTSDSADNSLSAKQGKLLNGYIDTLNSYFDGNGNAKTALKLTTARTLWGQSFDGSSNVSGNMTDVLSIYMSGGIIGPESIELNTNGGLQNFGGFIDFHYNGSLADYTSRIIEEASGVLSIQAGDRVLNETTGEYEFVGKAPSLVVGSGYNNSSIVIGNGKLVWDESNNSLKVIRSNGSAANIYATGGVSALGMQAGVSALDAMTFNYVTINNNLTFGAASRITHTVTNDDRTLYIGNSDNSGWVALQDVCSQRGITYWKIMANGEAFFAENVQSPKFYLDASRYLYLDSSNNLMFFNGTTAKQVAFVN